MKKIYTIFAVLVVLSLVLLAGCQSKQTTEQKTTADAITGNTVQDTGTDSTGSAASTGQVKEFNMVAKQFTFDPDTITVNKGDTVKLHIKSIDVTHGFALPQFGVSEQLAPGQVVDIQFVADKSGTFPFFCNVLCGAGHSDMRGKLVVQ